MSLAVSLLVIVVFMLLVWLLNDVFILLILDLIFGNIVLNFADYFPEVPSALVSWYLTVYAALAIIGLGKLIHIIKKSHKRYQSLLEPIYE